ncbi:MAG TPA: pseudouridine synthase [Chromatiaceae bacterium]|jgi:23S rRNA pseudouridine2457 synthase|nr:pseudouridine synthase [Chromatiaceae bacterium]HIA08872.1 pseudouridine synthase [Chromatiaceae bacterium]HIN81655.1 pseudouridine synthase [Chromatiales bacterium]HIO54467.1 pseudouridine synthase [Chromatiales bacterium]
MTDILLFNKPYGVLSQFTDTEGRETLADFIDIPNIYTVGRLDRDSEGLLLLTGDGKFKHRIADPTHKVWKTYWVQVEGTPDDDFLQQLRDGVELKNGKTRPAKARVIDAPDVWPRTPPVRFRKNVPDHWIELSICEGRNRQVRRMTAKAGCPTLRLIRYSIDAWTLDGLAPGESQLLTNIKLSDKRTMH